MAFDTTSDAASPDVSKAARCVSAIEHYLESGSMADLIFALECHDAVMSALGSAFGPCMSDFRGNIQKMRDGYEDCNIHGSVAAEDRRTHTLAQTLQAEKQHYSPGNVPDPSCGVGVCWACRGLDFTFLFLKELVGGTVAASGGRMSREEVLDQVGSVDASRAFKNAYERTLMQYHNWFMRSTIKTAVLVMLPCARVCVERIDFASAGELVRYLEVLEKLLEKCAEEQK